MSAFLALRFGMDVVALGELGSRTHAAVFRSGTADED